MSNTEATMTTEATSRDFNYRQHCIGRVKPLCLEAIETMRRFLDDAERGVNREGTTPERMIDTVTAKIGWGFANAAGNLSSALSALEAKSSRILLSLENYSFDPRSLRPQLCLMLT